MPRLQRGTVTFLFSDIEGSTRLLATLGRDRYGEAMADHARLLSEAFGAHAGEVIETQGDSFFVAFGTSIDAVAAAVAAQRAMAAHEWPAETRFRVRMGLHTGEATATTERYLGLAVHRAARVCAAAHGGQVLLSNTTRELVEDELPEGVSVRDLGTHRLKDFDRPERLSQLAVEGLPAEFPPLRTEAGETLFAGREGELALSAESALAREHPYRRRTILVGALAGVIAAAVAIPIFALSSGGSGGPPSYAAAGANAVAAVDASGARPSGSVALAAAPSSVAYGDGSVWVTVPAQNSVSRIDPSTNTVRQTIETGNGPTGIAVGGGFVWVANSLAGTVWQIDPRTNGGQVVNKIVVGNGPTGIAYGLGAVWVANSLDRTIVRINPVNGTAGRPIPVDAGADAVAAGDGAVWVVGNSAGVLSRVDPGAGAVTKPINVGSEPTAVAVGPGAVWVANSGDATVWEVDPGTNAVKATIPVGKEPSGVAVAPDGKTVWVSNELAGTLSRIDPAVDKVVKTVTVGDRPEGVAAGADAAYVAVKSAGGAHRGGTLTVVVPNPQGIYEAPLPKSLDPARGYTAWELLPLTNDGLLGYGRAGGADSNRVVPDLAASMPAVADGGRTYTFQLRPGIRYSTGALVRPADIRRGIERSLVLGGGTTPNSYLGGIAGAASCTGKAKRCDLSAGISISPGSSTLTFHLTAPDPDFLYKLALPMADAVPASTPLEARLPLPATGPYEVGAYDAKRGVIRLVRNPHFHIWSAAAQPDGFPDQIVERWGFSGPTAVQSVERGSADITAEGYDVTWPPALAASLRTRYSSRLYEATAPGRVWVWLNTRRPPFDDVRVRRAVNYAIDRTHVPELASGVGGEVGCQILPPNLAGYQRYCPYTAQPNPAGTYKGPDLAKARQLVAESGTKGEKVEIWFYDIPIGRRNGAYFAATLRSLGYKVKLELVPHSGSTWAPDRQAGVSGWTLDYPSTSNFMSPLFTCAAYSPDPSKNSNVSGVCDKRIDALIARAQTLQTSDPSAASRTWHTLDRQLTDLAPLVVLRTIELPVFVSSRVRNYTTCFLSTTIGVAGACLDELWVR